MIKTKDDMRGCYVPRADKEVFELFMDKCEELGVKWATGHKPRGWHNGDLVIFGGVHCDDLTSANGEAEFKYKGYRRLTKQDFIDESKVKTKTEYTKITASIFDLKDDFEAGNIYYQVRDGVYLGVTSVEYLADLLSREAAYLRTERELTLHEACEDYLSGCKYLSRHCDINTCICPELRYAAEQQEFIGLCKLVAEYSK